MTLSGAKDTASIWSRHLITLAIAVFFINFGQGLFRGASTNFFVDTLGLSGTHVLWLAGLREVPGLLLIFIAALVMHLSLTSRSAVSVLVMGIGYGLYALANSFVGLVVVAVIGSLGFHNWMPLQRSLAMELTTKEKSGRVMGSLSAVQSLASIVGMGCLALTARYWQSLSLRVFYVLGSVLIGVAALLILRLPSDTGATSVKQPRMLLKRRYWLYYVLTFFEGSRMQVFGTFGTLIVSTKLAFQNAVVTLHLLLLTQMDRVIGRLAASERTHSRRRLATLESTLRCIAAWAFEKQLRPFATTLSTNGCGLASHTWFNSKSSTQDCKKLVPMDELYATAFLRPASVVRNRRDVLDRLDLQTGRLQSRDGTLASTAGSLHFHVDLFHAELDRLLGHLLRGQLAGEGSTLPTALESARTGTCPAERIALGVGNRNRCVVERRSDVGYPHRHVATYFASF